jgi:hypothetical protein
MDDIRNQDDTCLHDPLEHLLDRCSASLDRHELLAEVDRLTAQVRGFPFLPYIEGQNAERARILAAVEALPYWTHFPDNAGPDDMDRAAVITAIKGETSDD